MQATVFCVIWGQIPVIVNGVSYHFVLADAAFPLNVVLSISYSAFVKGDHTNFEIDSSFGIEATELYPEVEYTTVDQVLDQLVWVQKQELVQSFHNHDLIIDYCYIYNIWS